MSHNVEIEGVEFRDLQILEKAVNELRAEGVIKGEFKTGEVTVRGWRGSAGEGIVYHNTAWDKEMNHTCPAGILFPEEKYDIGFNYDSKKGAYVPFVESSWRTPVAADAQALTIHGKAGHVPTSHALPGGSGHCAVVGKLAQRYAVLMAEKNAAMHGLPTRRIQAKGGQIQLHVTHTR